MQIYSRELSNLNLFISFFKQNNIFIFSHQIQENNMRNHYNHKKSLAIL